MGHQVKRPPELEILYVDTDEEPRPALVLDGLKADLLRLVSEPLFLQAAVTSLAIALASGLLAVIAALTITRARHAIAAAR